MPDVADRIRVEPRAKSRPKNLLGRAAALAPSSKQGLGGAALVAMMIGIVVNALALQHGRRIDLPPDPAATASLKPAPAPSPVVAAAPEKAAAPEPPRPAPTAVAVTHAPKSGDAIADFLRTQGPDKRKLTISAQNALTKLGFKVKATGVLDADTRHALAEFAKSHHQPVSAEITAKLVKSLNAAVAAD